MTRVVEILPAGSVLDLVGSPNEGMSAQNKILNIQTENGAATVYAKLYRYQFNLLNEIIGYLLAHHLNLPQPEGFVILLSQEEQTQYFGITNPVTNKYPVWATKQIDGNSAIFEYKACTKALKQDLFEWINFYQVISFDDWIGNRDRNIGNLIRYGAGKYKIIDHGEIFDGFKYRKKSKLDKQKLTTNKLSHYCLKERIQNRSIEATKKHHHAKIGAHAQSHFRAFLQSQPEVFFWWHNLTKGNESKLYNYLYNRCKQDNHIIHRKYNLLAI